MTSSPGESHQPALIRNAQSLPLEPALLVRNVNLSKVSACSALKPHERGAGYDHLCLGELLSFQQFDERVGR
jgi:hypothetical protein